MLISANYNKPEDRVRHGLLSASAFFLGTFLILLLLNGCSNRLPRLNQLSPLPAGPLCRVAVLPLQNQSQFVLGDTIFYKIFTAELVQTGNFLISQEGDIRKIYQQLHIFPDQQPSFEQIQILADRLDVQLIITGDILEMGTLPAGNGMVNPSLAVMLRLYDAKTGRTLWDTYHRREGSFYQKIMHFGQVNTITGLSRHLSEEILALWLSEGLQPCNFL